MKLLSKTEVNKDLKKQRDEITEKNQRLLGYMTKGIKRLNSLKDDYGPDREKKLKEFENFLHDITKKKSEMLKELKAYNALIEERKDIYYALVEKQDKIEEELEILNRKKQNLDDRERFIIASEEKLEAKWNSLLKN